MTEVLEQTIAGLPAPVQRSLRQSGVVGSKIPTSVEVWQKGRIRQAPKGRWLSFTAHEIYTLDQPGFVWNAALKSAGITVGRATDSLRDGTGRMHVRVLGLFNVVDATGSEMDQGSLSRWLNETMWFPAVWATDVISWVPIDENSAAGTVEAGGLSVQAEFQFDSEGRLIDFRTDRYRDTGSGFELSSWSTPLVEHARFSGIELPSRGSAVWNLEEDDFEYIQIRATDVRYT